MTPLENNASFLGLNIRSVNCVHRLFLRMISCFVCRQFQFYDTHPWRLLVTSWPFEIFLDQTRKRGVETRLYTYFLRCPQWLHHGCRQQLAATTTELSEQQSKWFFPGRFCCWFNLHQSAKAAEKGQLVPTMWDTQQRLGPENAHWCPHDGV